MSLGLDEVVVVNIAIAPTPVALKTFGSLLFVSNEVGNVFVGEERSRLYNSLDAVSDDFAAVAEIMKAATSFYAQQPKPRDFYVGKMQTVAAGAKLTGVGSSTLAELKFIGAGGFTLPINGNDVTISGIDLTSVIDMAEVATELQSALTLQLAGTTVAFVPVSGLVAEHFVITAPLAGVFRSEIGAAHADVGGLADKLHLSVAKSPIVTSGSLVETPVQALVEIEDWDNSFYGVAVTRAFRDTPAIDDVADWVEGSARVFFNATNDLQTLVTGQVGHVAARLKAKSLLRTISQYSSTPAEYPEVSVAGRAFTVNFEGKNTTITLNLKSMPTITAEAGLTKSNKVALEKTNCNAVMVIAGKNVYSDSRMANASWFDTVHGIDWLQNRIQTDVFNLLYTTTTKIPYTDTGIGMIVQKVQQGLNQGVSNGLIAVGGVDSTGEVLLNGYVIEATPAALVSQADKGNRIYRGITFRVVGAGAIHKVEINGSFTE